MDESTLTEEELSERNIEFLISIWSIRPAPNSAEGKAWEAGAKQGWKWSQAKIAELNNQLKREQARRHENIS